MCSTSPSTLLLTPPFSPFRLHARPDATRAVQIGIPRKIPNDIFLARKSDVVIVLDSSASISDQEWVNSLKFAYDFGAFGQARDILQIIRQSKLIRIVIDLVRPHQCRSSCLCEGCAVVSIGRVARVVSRHCLISATRTDRPNEPRIRHVDEQSTSIVSEHYGKL